MDLGAKKEWERKEMPGGESRYLNNQTRSQKKTHETRTKNARCGLE